MIYITGDIHGSLEIDKVVDFLNAESKKRVLTKNDYVIILGDVGVCWDNGIKDRYVREILHNLLVTTLFIDGNHENFGLLSKYSVSSWNGGNVQKIESDIIHLMRGQVYEIEGKTFFTFGGAFSIDKAYRREGISWWNEEMPSAEEYERGLQVLNAHGNKVDYILTHAAPFDIVLKMGIKVFQKEQDFLIYLQMISNCVDFQKWYFGHYHKDIEIDGVFHGVMEEGIRLL